MPKTTFSASLNGFRFANRFVNNVVRLPIFGDITTMGRCGGMSYASLDCYYHSYPLPATTEQDLAATGGVPADGTLLADYIFKRQIDSFLVPSAAKFVTWSVAMDESTLFLRGVTRWTREDEFPKLQSAIDQGNPIPLGLVVARDLGGLARNHQVVAYGYEYDFTNDGITIYIYDNNHPEQEVTLTSNRDIAGFVQSTGEQWRGFFVQDYTLMQPPANLNAFQTLASVKTLTTSPVKHLTVVFETIQLHGDEDTYGKSDIALSLSVNEQTLRWPRVGMKNLKIGKEYIINRALDVDVTEVDKLLVVASGAENLLGDVPMIDNDEQVAAVSKEYSADQRWGRGKHADSVGGAAGGYTIRYTIKSRR